MAQRGHLTATGLAFQKKTFIAKTEFVVMAKRKHTLFGITMQTQAFVAKTAAVAVSLKHRSLYMAINYESILEDVTPSDTVDLSATGMLYIGTGGDVKVDAINSGTVTLKNVPNGTWLNFMRVKRVYSTGTTATDIVLAR